ncbi:MAG: FkbM family methyltransferase [Lachnospiraceae bacterium]|nr:FkbM family methyltransferase [Lachnospiraceae bacterium]
MKNYSNIDDLITELNNGTFNTPNTINRKKMIFVPVIKEIPKRIKMQNTDYKHNKISGIPVIRNIIVGLEILRQLRWLNMVYPQKRCDNYVCDTKEELLNHADEYKEAFALFDDKSKRIYLDLLCLRLTGDFNYVIPHYKLSPQYLSDRIKWKNSPNIVDAGGYIGDTLMSFLSAGIIPGKYQIYELEAKNYKHLVKNINKARKLGVKVRATKKGLYSENKTLYFVPKRDSSQIVDYETPDKIDVVKLDSDLKIIPDFIKMDIEGSEVEALKGSAEVIKKYSPTLAICIYHLKDDFRKIPLLIKEINPNYKYFWIEHYQLGYNETVLYASI